MGKVAFSVVVPAYNVAASVVDALRSIVEDETDYAYEVIVVDDGSTDDTARLVKGFGQEVKLISKDHAGPGSARNVGVREAQSEVVLFLDADDRVLPGRFRSQVPYMLNHQDVVFSFGDVVYQDRETYNHHEAWGLPVAGDGFSVLAEPLERLVSQGCYPPTASVAAVRREAYFSVGGQREDVRVGEDYDCWCKLASLGAVACSGGKFAWMRRGGDHRHLTNSRYVYTDAPIALMGILERYRGQVSTEAYRLGFRRFVWSSEMMMRYLWIEDGQASVVAAGRQLSPLLPDRIAARWRRLSRLPQWLPKVARDLIRRTRGEWRN